MLRYMHISCLVQLQFDVYFFQKHNINTLRVNLCTGQCAKKNGNPILFLIMDKHLHYWQNLKIVFAVVMGNERVSLFR